jgi:hypothetical protein
MFSSWTPQTAKDRDWLSMYTMYKLSRTKMRGRWGATSRPNVKKNYDAYRSDKGLGDAGFYINSQDKTVFEQHSRALFARHHDVLCQLFTWRGVGGDLAVARLKLVVEEYEKLRTMGGRKSIDQSVCASVIEHLEYRVPEKDRREIFEKCA